MVGQAALALSQLKAKDTAPAIAEKLPRASAALAKNLLTALAALEDPKVLPSVLAFIETQQSAECTGAIAEVIRRWKSKELLAPSLKMVLRGSSATEEAADLVRAVDKAITAADRDAIAALKRILSESGMSFEVKEECAYALYTARDPFGKTWLLQPVNDAIRENPEGATLLRSRARIYLRLKLYREAQRDFEEVKKLASVNKKASIDGEEWIEVARANAGAKSYQPAADAIRNALGLGIRPKGFRDLPEFADMRKQQKYAGLFDGD